MHVYQVTTLFLDCKRTTLRAARSPPNGNIRHIIRYISLVSQYVSFDSAEIGPIELF